MPVNKLQVIRGSEGRCRARSVSDSAGRAAGPAHGAATPIITVRGEVQVLSPSRCDGWSAPPAATESHWPRDGGSGWHSRPLIIKLLKLKDQYLSYASKNRSQEFQSRESPFTGRPQPFKGWGAAIKVAHVTGNVAVNDCAGHDSVMLAGSYM